jgi:hypothetical protein
MNYYAGHGDYDEKSVEDFLSGIQKNKFFFAKMETFPEIKEISE